ncbi:TPA: YopX family protein [Streptococcus suis]
MIPKFRAYNPATNDWYKPEEVFVSDGNIYLDDDDFDELTQNNDVILMQSTGLFDKNGKEVFEGDVVKLRYTISSDYEFFKVTRLRGGSWRIDNRRRGCELWLRNEDCEIIGNIYENTELVEG